MKIGIDFDDTVAASIEAIIHLHNEKYGTNYRKEDVFTYKAAEVWGGTQEEWQAKLDEFFSAKHVEHLDPIAGAIPAMDALKKAGHELYIITARSSVDDVEATELWLRLHFPDTFKGVHYGMVTRADPTSWRYKSEICKELGVELIIDDHLSNATECAIAGIRVMLFDKPWNQGELPSGIERVHSWEEVVEKLRSF